MEDFLLVRSAFDKRLMWIYRAHVVFFENIWLGEGFKRFITLLDYFFVKMEDRLLIIT